MVILTKARLRTIALITLAFAIFAFCGSQLLFAIENNGEEQSKNTTLTYQYTGTDEDDVTNENAWQDVTNGNPQFCDEEPDLPCTVEFDSSEYADIEAFIDAHPSLEEIMGSDELISTKSEG